MSEQLSRRSTALRGPTRGTAAEMTRKRLGAQEGSDVKRQKTLERLPPDWEKHWSDQYSTHYYWNSKSGESTWTVPK